MNDAISKRITKGCFTRFTRCNTKGPTRPTSLKGFLYPPICKKNGWFWEAKQLLSWFLFQPAILVYQKVFHTLLNEILPKKDWIPSSNLDMLLTKSCTSCREKKYPMTHNVFTSGSPNFLPSTIASIWCHHAIMSCPFPQTTGKPDIEQAGVQLELAQAMEARKSAIFGEELRVDCPSVSMFVVWGIHVFLGHFWVIERNPGFLGKPGCGIWNTLLILQGLILRRNWNPRILSYWVHGTCHILWRKLVDWFSGTENSSEVHFTNLSLNFKVTQHLFLALVFASWICNNTGMRLPKKNSFQQSLRMAELKTLAMIHFWNRCSWSLKTYYDIYWASYIFPLIFSFIFIEHLYSIQ